MKVSRSTRIAFLFLSAFLFQTDRFMASAAAVPPGACLYALDPTADRAFQIAGAQSVRAGCGAVVDSRVCDGVAMEGSDKLQAAFAPIDAIGHNTVEANRRSEDEKAEAVHHMGNSKAIAYSMVLVSTLPAMSQS